MSGGFFDYKQYELSQMADQIEQLIVTNDSEELNEWGDKKGLGYSKETIQEFKHAVNILNLAATYAHRVDWLVSGDDGEDSFKTRLEHDIKTLKVLR